MKNISFRIENCKGCRLCVEACPQKILRSSEKLNSKGFNYVEITDKDKCTRCGMCYLVCPDQVIEIE